MGPSPQFALVRIAAAANLKTWIGYNKQASLRRDDAGETLTTVSERQRPATLQGLGLEVRSGIFFPRGPADRTRFSRRDCPLDFRKRLTPRNLRVT
ncbi:hypothetical protein D9M72_382530 [compost metagenome]